MFTEIAIPVNFTKKHSRKIKDTVLQTDQVSAGMEMKEGSAARGHSAIRIKLLIMAMEMYLDFLIAQTFTWVTEI